MAELVTVTGRFELPDNTPPTPPGSMTWWMLPSEIPEAEEPVTMVSGPVIAEIDETGAFTVELRATDDPDLTAHVEGEIVYSVQRSGVSLDREAWLVTVPAPGPWDWTELSPQLVNSPIGVVMPVPGPQGEPGEKFWESMTEDQYQALPVKDPDVLYVLLPA